MKVVFVALSALIVASAVEAGILSDLFKFSKKDKEIKSGRFTESDEGGKFVKFFNKDKGVSTTEFVQPVHEVQVQQVLTPPEVYVQPFIQPVHEVQVQQIVQPIYIQESCTPQTQVHLITRHKVSPLIEQVTAFYDQPTYTHLMTKTVLSTHSVTQFVQTTVSLLPFVATHTETILRPAFTTLVHPIQAIQYEIATVPLVVTEKATTSLTITQTDIELTEFTNTVTVFEEVSVPAYLDGSIIADVTITTYISEPIYLTTATTTLIHDEPAAIFTVTVPEYHTIVDCPVVVETPVDIFPVTAISYTTTAITETLYNQLPGEIVNINYHDGFHTLPITEIATKIETSTTVRVETQSYTDIVLYTVPVAEVSYSTIAATITQVPEVDKKEEIKQLFDEKKQEIKEKLDDIKETLEAKKEEIKEKLEAKKEEIKEKLEAKKDTK